MARPSEKEKIVQAVNDYLREKESSDPDQYPFNVKSIALALNISRTTIYKYGLHEDIQTADEQRRLRLELYGVLSKSDRALLANQKLKSELEQADKRNKALVARLNIVELNAARLGVDAEELFKPLQSPVR